MGTLHCLGLLPLCICLPSPHPSTSNATSTKKPARLPQDTAILYEELLSTYGLPRWVKNPPVNTGDAGDGGLILGLRGSARVVNGNPFQYSCLENSKDRGVRWGREESDMTEHTHTHTVSQIHHQIPGFSPHDGRYTPH